MPPGIEKPTGDKKGYSLKRQGFLYGKICDRDNIREAIKNAALGKKNRHDVQEVMAHLDESADYLSDLLSRQAWRPAPYIVDHVREGSNNKMREIRKPKYWPDQCVHWAIYQIIGPSVYSGFYDISCGSVPGKGVHYGKKFVERWVREDKKNTKYYLKMDIHHFYPSVKIDILMDMISRKFKDQKLLDLLSMIFAQYDGLPIGVLLSQVFANFYLTPTDYFIKQSLHARYYIRYMDDMVIFSANKKALHKMRREIGEFVAGYGLELKYNWQVSLFDKEPLDFMGFRFYRDHTTLRRSIMLRITRKVAKVDRKGDNITPKDAAGVLSYMGWISHSDSYALFNDRIRPHLHIQKLKSIVRKGAKNENAQKPKHD